MVYTDAMAIEQSHRHCSKPAAMVGHEKAQGAQPLATDHRHHRHLCLGDKNTGWVIVLLIVLMATVLIVVHLAAWN